MDKFRLPNTVDFHLPSILVGRSLPWRKDGGVFDVIKCDIDIYYSGPVDLKKLMKIVDDVDQTEVMGFQQSMKVLGHIMSYLRIKLLSRDVRIVEMTAVLLDVLVKNCQYRVHIYVGRKIFMKTFCLVFRQLLADERERHRCAGIRMLDILQGWGEAFSKKRREVYPYIVASYEKTRYKYGIRYPRPDFDPTRVPIFLGEINKYELDEANETRALRGIFESSKSPDFEDSPRTRMEESKNEENYSIDSLSPRFSYVEKHSPAGEDSDLMIFEDDQEVTTPLHEGLSHRKDMNNQSPKEIYHELMEFEELPPTDQTDISQRQGPVPPYGLTPLLPPSVTVDGTRPWMDGFFRLSLPISAGGTATSEVTDIVPYSGIEMGTTNRAEDINSDIDTTTLPQLPPTPLTPIRYYTTSPYYGGITRGIIPTKSLDESERLLAVLNADVQQMLCTMKEEGVARPAIKTEIAEKSMESSCNSIDNDTWTNIPDSPTFSRVALTSVKMEIVGETVPSEGSSVIEVKSLSPSFISPPSSSSCIASPLSDAPHSARESMKTVDQSAECNAYEDDFQRHDIRSASLSEMRSDSCDAVNGDNTDVADGSKGRYRRRSTGYAPPSSDPSVEVRYFGHQRVVIKKR